MTKPKRKPRPLPTKKEIAETEAFEKAKGIRPGQTYPTPKWVNCASCGKRINVNDGTGGTHTCFVRPMGVPCGTDGLGNPMYDFRPGTVISDPTRTYDLANRFPPTTSEKVAMHGALAEPFPSAVAWADVRYLTAKGLLALARTIRRLAWKVAP